MNELALFAGAGGGILGGHLLGWRTVCAVEWEPYAASVLAARQNDGLLPPFPIWDDVQTFDGRPWRGCVDVVSGGFPCQDISVAGKGAGINGARSGMWSHMARIVGEVRPRYVFVENSPALLTRGLGRVLGDLAALGYDCRWTVLGAGDIGAPHQRDRFWLVAHANCTRMEKHWSCNADSSIRSSPSRSSQEPQKIGSNVAYAASGEPRQSPEWKGRQSVGRGGGDCGRIEAARGEGVADADCLRQLQPQGSKCDQRGWVGDGGTQVSNACSQNAQGQWSEPIRVGSQLSDISDASWWQSESDVGRVAHGVAARVDRLKAIGNGQVPLCAATAWRLLTA